VACFTQAAARWCGRVGGIGRDIFPFRRRPHYYEKTQNWGALAGGGTSADRRVLAGGSGWRWLLPGQDVNGAHFAGTLPSIRAGWRGLRVGQAVHQLRKPPCFGIWRGGENHAKKKTRGKAKVPNSNLPKRVKNKVPKQKMPFKGFADNGRGNTGDYQPRETKNEFKSATSSR